MVCHELVPTVVGIMRERNAAGHNAMQSCVFRELPHVVDDFETQLSSPRFRPWLAYHEAHGIEGAIAVAHGVHNHDADRPVVPDQVFVFNVPPIIAHAIIMAALILAA